MIYENNGPIVKMVNPLNGECVMVGHYVGHKDNKFLVAPDPYCGVCDVFDCLTFAPVPLGEKPGFVLEERRLD